MFTVQTYQKTEYSRRNENQVITAKQYNIPATAFLGAISEQDGFIHYRLYKKSVNAEKFIDWL